MIEKVNVLLHGVFGYLFTADYIEAYVPAVSGHIYKVSQTREIQKSDGREAEKLIAECLPREDLKLVGIVRGKKIDLDPKISPVVKMRKGSTFDEFGKRFCKIFLPYPNSSNGNEKIMFPLDKFHVGSIFSGKHGSHCNKVQPYPSMHAFVYERDRMPLQFERCDGKDPIRLDHLRRDADTPHGVTNIHVWCTTPPMDMAHASDGHLRRAFPALVDIFPGLEVTIQIPDGFTPAAAEIEERPYGVTLCDVDPSRKECASHFGHVNCHYANLFAVEE